VSDLALPRFHAGSQTATQHNHRQGHGQEGQPVQGEDRRRAERSQHDGTQQWTGQLRRGRAGEKGAVRGGALLFGRRGPQLDHERRARHTVGGFQQDDQ
jgi:hypothetical protein